MQKQKDLQVPLFDRDWVDVPLRLPDCDPALRPLPLGGQRPHRAPSIRFRPYSLSLTSLCLTAVSQAADTLPFCGLCNTKDNIGAWFYFAAFNVLLSWYLAVLIDLAPLAVTGVITLLWGEVTEAMKVHVETYGVIKGWIKPSASNLFPLILFDNLSPSPLRLCLEILELTYVDGVCWESSLLRRGDVGVLGRHLPADLQPALDN